MKKDIIVYGRDRGVRNFLKDFFKDRKDYSARFIQNRNILKKELEKKPAALLLDSPDGLGETENLNITVPVIALISREVTKGIRSVIKSDVECYLLSPFHKDELESKLKVVTRGKSWLESLYMDGKTLHVIVELSYLFSSTLNPKEVLSLVVKKLAEIIKAKRCSILSINPDNRRYAEVISTFEDPDIVDLKIDLQKYPEIRNVINLRGPFEKVKHFSSIYPYNSLIFQIVGGTLMLRKSGLPDLKGYIPLYRTMKAEKIDTFNLGNFEIDENKILAMKDIISTCKQKNIALVFVHSPFWRISTDSYCSSIISGMCSENGINYLDMSNDSTFINKPDYFDDISHLNNKGAEVFTNMLIDRIYNSY